MRLDRRALEDYATWEERSGSAFLMRLGEKLFGLAFPTEDAVADPSDR